MANEERTQIHPWLSRGLKDRVDGYRTEHNLTVNAAVIVLLTSALDAIEDRQRYMDARIGREDQNE